MILTISHLSNETGVVFRETIQNDSQHGWKSMKAFMKSLKYHYQNWRDGDCRFVRNGVIEFHNEYITLYKMTGEPKK